MILPPLAPALLALSQPGATGGPLLPPPALLESAVQAGQNKGAIAVQAAQPVPETPPPAPSPSSMDTIAKASPAARPTARVRHAHAPGDPLEGFNRRMFRIQDGLDRALIRPAAIGYRHVVPKPVRTGLRHVLSNLGEPVVFLNFLLQHKIGKAVETLARFTVNSTLGVGGLIDVARLPSIGLPHRPNGFGDTLGFYGVKPGPYLFLPLVGPTTLRDFIGGQADTLTLPVLIGGEPFNQREYLVPSIVIGGLDQREQADEDLKALYAGAVDRYATLRSTYLQDRQGEIDALRGHATNGPLLNDALEDPAAKTKPAPELSDPLDDPAKPTAQPPAKPTSPELSDPLTDPAAPPKP